MTVLKSVFLLFLLTGASQAGSPFLVSDLQGPQPGQQIGSDPQTFVYDFDRMLFSADDTRSGREPWLLPMAPETPVQLLADIHVGAAGSQPRFLASSQIVAGVPSRYCYVADDGVHGDELWCTELDFVDGTPRTYLVKNIRPGSAGSLPRDMLYDPNQNLFLFVADDGIHGAELWRTTGAEGDASLVRDINPGPFGSTPRKLAKIPGSGRPFMFFAGTSTQGFELWRSDGTTGGTSLVRDILPGTGNGYYTFWEGPAAVLVGNYYFFANDGTSTGPQLWRSAGTAASTIKVLNLPADAQGTSDMIACGSVIYFGVSRPGQPRQLWTSDGSAAGTYALSGGQFTGSGAGGAVCNEFPPSTRKRLYFRGPQGRLWVTSIDNTVAGPLTNLHPSDDRVSEIIGSHRPSLQASDRLYFVGRPLVNDNWPNQTLWSLNLQSGDLENLRDGSFRPRSLIHGNVQNRFFLSARSSTGRELWRHQPTTGLTTLREVANIAPDGGSSWPRVYASGNGRLLFSAYRFDVGRELWSSTGAPEGQGPAPELLADADAGPSGALTPQAIAQAQPVLHQGIWYYYARSSGSGMQLWRSDGTAFGTYALTGQPGGLMDTFSEFAQNCITSSSGLLYFCGRDPNNSSWMKVWRSDGTPQGTFVAPSLLDDPRVEPTRGAGPNLAALGPHVYFPCRSGPQQGLCRSIGEATSPETLLLWSSAVEPRWLTVMGDRLYLVTRSFSVGVFDDELWSTNGFLDGQSTVRELDPDTPGLRPRGLVVHEGRLYFSAEQPGEGRQLWVSDGTDGGTHPVAPVVMEPDGPNPYGMTSTAIGLVFAQFTAEHGQELWLTDGSPAGTRMLGDLEPGPDGSQRARWISGDGYHSNGGNQGTGFTFFDEDINADNVPRPYRSNLEAISVDDQRIAFRACTRRHGCQLWLSDGSASGSYRLTASNIDSDPPLGLNPGYLTLHQGRVYFAGESAENGRELLGLDLPAADDLIFRDLFGG